MDDVELTLATDGYHLTDVGNSSRLIDLAEGNLRYVRAWGKWIAYRDGHYVIDEKDVIVTEMAKQVARDLMRTLPSPGTYWQEDGRGRGTDQRERELQHALKSESAHAITSMTKLARGVPGVMTEHEDLDADPELFNVANVTINLRTGEPWPHDPGELLTMQSPVTYDPNATAPLWEECLEKWQPDPEIRRYLQVRAGACATGRPTETFDVDYGTGGNGKGKFHGAIMHVLGPYAVVPHKSLLVAEKHEQHATVVASLFRARCAVASETKARCTLNEEMIKNLTGGDRLGARRMREDEWWFDPSHTMILSTNYEPVIKGTDNGIWRRVRLVPWTVTIPEDEQDPDLADKLKAEASGILNKVIEGARIFLAEGLDVPESVRVASDEYRAGQDLVGRFVREALEITGDEKTMTVAAIMAAAETWATDAGYKYAPSMASVAAVLMKKGCKKLDRRVTIEGHKHTVWSGLAMAPDTLDTPLRLSPIEGGAHRGDTEGGVQGVRTSTNYGAMARQSVRR